MPALVEAMAGDFGDQLGCAARCAFGHQLEQVARLGRGVDGGAHFAGYMIFDGSDQDGSAGGGVEQSFREKCGGGFAVGAGNAGGGELALRMPEEGCRSLGECATAVLDFEDGQACLENGEVVEGLRGVGDDAECARGDGFVDDSGCRRWSRLSWRQKLSRG